MILSWLSYSSSSAPKWVVFRRLESPRRHFWSNSRLKVVFCVKKSSFCLNLPVWHRGVLCSGALVPGEFVALLSGAAPWQWATVPRTFLWSVRPQLALHCLAAYSTSWPGARWSLALLRVELLPQHSWGNNWMKCGIKAVNIPSSQPLRNMPISIPNTDT